jgi:hypothetical protein
MEDGSAVSIVDRLVRGDLTAQGSGTHLFENYGWF